MCNNNDECDCECECEHEHNRTIYEFMGNHPYLTFFIFLIIFDCLSNVGVAAFKAMGK